jgi:hypothetical protein
VIQDPDDELATEVRVARWDKLQPADNSWPNLVGESAPRDQVIEQLRDLADFLDERPEIPVPLSSTTMYFTVFAAGTDQEKCAQVDYLSTLLGAPVTDDLADGGNYTVSVPFGGIKYQFVAIPREPVERAPVSFAVGQEVQIVPEVARTFRRAGMAQAGVIVSASEQDGHYLVRVPGRKTVPMPGTMLQPAGAVSVDTLSGTATSLAEVETWLVDAVARTRISEHRGQVPDSRDVADVQELGFAFGRICGLPSGTLLAQLEPAISARTELYQLADRGGPPKGMPAQVAARDGSSRGLGEHRSGVEPRAADRTGTAQPSPRHRR